MSDTRTSTLSTLSTPDQPKPYVYVTKRGEKVELPNPGLMELEEAEEFLNSLSRESDSTILKKWVGDEGYEKIRADKMNLLQKNALFEDIFRHYKDIFGTQGE